MRIFVTGAAGFLGRAFCESAARAGHDLLGLSRSREATSPEGCSLVEGSLANIPWDAIERFAADAALHLAWIATPGNYLNSPDNAVWVEQSEALFQGLARRGIRQIAGTGTCIEYAPSDLPLSEDKSPLAPASPYAAAKVETCRRLESLAATEDISWSWFRVFYPYGEGEHPDRMPSALLRKFCAGEAVELKTPDSVKDYIHITDVARGMLAALEGRITGPVNIGTGNGVRIMELARMLARCCDCDAALVTKAEKLTMDPFPTTVADITKLQANGWRPSIALEDGIQRLWKSLKRE